VSPLIAGGAFKVCAAGDARGGVTAWTESATGRICMEAKASF
jgi:hypothetical protein